MVVSFRRREFPITADHTKLGKSGTRRSPVGRCARSAPSWPRRLAIRCPCPPACQHPPRPGVPAVATSDGRAYSDRTRRLASRAFDLIAAYDRAAADHAAALGVFRHAEASAPVGDETGARSVAPQAAAAAAT